MLKKINILIVILFSFYVLSSAQQNIRNTKSTQKTDSLQKTPTNFDYTLDYMLNSWAISKLKEVNHTPKDEIVVTSDSIIKIRLSKMPYLVELPFNKDIRNFIDIYTVRKKKQMENVMGMSNYYFPILEQELAAKNLPLELKNLTIVESALNPNAISCMGAAGLWQLMIPTGRMCGLEINSLVDERLSPQKSTLAATRFLKDLYSIYGDWNLVIASYNCGPGNVNKAIRRAGGKRDFWQIYPFLPSETRSYLPLFIAASYTFRYAKEHNMYPAKTNMPAITDTVLVNTRIHFEQIASVLNIPIEEVKILNPQYVKNIIPGDIKPYAITLPINYIGKFIDNFTEIANYKTDSLINNRRKEIDTPKKITISKPSSQKQKYYTVKNGDNLTSIAENNRTSVSKIKKANNINGSVIKPGQKLKIPK